MNNKPNTMNAASAPSPSDLLQDNIDSDTDSLPDSTPDYYQPISSLDDGGHESGSESGSDSAFDGPVNGYCNSSTVENGVSSLRLRDEEDDLEERIVEEEDVAIRRAFREDDDRRNAPLDPSNVSRVMEAMRGVEFGGTVPDWAGQVPEDQWIDRLRRLRQLPSGPSSSV